MDCANLPDCTSFGAGRLACTRRVAMTSDDGAGTRVGVGLEGAGGVPWGAWVGPPRCGSVAPVLGRRGVPLCARDVLADGHQRGALPPRARVDERVRIFINAS